MRRYFLFVIVLALSANLAKSQNLSDSSPKSNYRMGIIKLLGKHMNIDRLMETPGEHLYIFSICLSFNKTGGVDTVYFSDIKSENLKKIVNSDRDLTKAARLLDFKKEFANKLVIFPIILKRDGDWRINNQDEFINGILTMWPKLNLNDQSKPAVLLDPFINRYMEVKN